jgi:ubiquinone/menaquinone biosynthesis C-methylase UbiE
MTKNVSAYQIFREGTNDIYGALFNAYSKKMFDDSVELFFKRHKKWDIDLSWFKDKSCLDAGCGGGRFMVALAKLGAKEVRGIDISAKAVASSNQRLRERGLRQAVAIEASVLDIPYPDNYFDYVVSSGVIHHTPNPHGAFLELARVIKPGGVLFLSVYGSGGIRWLVNDFFRYSLCKIVPFNAMEKIFSLLCVPANKRYNILDNLYVPYCYRFKERKIQNWLLGGGFQNQRRVKFERYDYEKLSSRILYGEGWIQIYAQKMYNGVKTKSLCAQL